VGYYVVQVKNRPISFLQIEPPLHRTLESYRANADAQMRAKFRELGDLTPRPRLHGVSVMGQNLAFYCLDKDKARIDPTYVAPSTIYTDTVPEKRWDADITTERGYQALMTVIDDVKQMVQA
ncbi:hypothetical protein PAXINDRAFT_48328, partial [Paxillus involutus ATCC 200175]